MSEETLAKAKKLVGEVMAGHLATTDGGQPRVRPIAMRWVGENELWFATYTGSRKVAQLEANPAVEVAFSDPQWNHVRLCGDASMSQDADREKLLGLIPELAQHFAGPADPNFTLVKIALECAEYLPMGTTEYETHEF